MSHLSRDAVASLAAGEPVIFEVTGLVDCAAYHRLAHVTARLDHGRIMVDPGGVFDEDGVSADPPTAELSMRLVEPTPERIDAARRDAVRRLCRNVDDVLENASSATIERLHELLVEAAFEASVNRRAATLARARAAAIN
jgi:hypothetical protein